jgi:hypothetical protein
LFCPLKKKFVRHFSNASQSVTKRHKCVSGRKNAFRDKKIRTRFSRLRDQRNLIWRISPIGKKDCLKHNLKLDIFVKSYINFVLLFHERSERTK